MTLLRDACERVAAVAAETTVAEACARFASDPETRLLPVQDGRSWLGLLTRNVLLEAAQRADLYRSPIGELSLQPAVVLEADRRLASLTQALTGGAEHAAFSGYVVLDRDESYVGVGDGATLLRAAQGARSGVRTLLEGVRREVAGPLEGLVAVAALMQRQPLSLDGAAHLKTMIAGAQSALAYISDLAVQFAPGVALSPELNVEPVTLSAVLDEVDMLWQVQAALRGLRLITSCRMDPELRVSVDAPRLKQVLNGLVNDAFDRSFGGVVEAQLLGERVGDVVRAEIRVRHVPRAGAETGDVESFDVAGTPIGAVVEAMRGRLRREPNQGAGATAVFELELPVAGPQVTTLVAEELSALGHILIVDDNATNRLVAEALCEGFGFTCETAEGGAEGVAAVEQRGFDLVLMDIKMPGVDGLQATRAIRTLSGPRAATPILALTANADPDQVAAYRAAGMLGVVEKPIKPDALFKAISAVLFGGAETQAARAVAA